LRRTAALVAVALAAGSLCGCHGSGGALGRGKAAAAREEPAGEPAPAAAGEPPPATWFAPDDRSAGERLPLLIVLHGYGDSGQGMADGLQLAAFARRHRAVVVAPNGTPDRRGRLFWNAGGGCCDLDRSGIDDVARLTALIDRWRARPDVDPRRVYVVGHSNGGFMAHRLACAIADRLTAVASTGGAGPTASTQCQPAAPIAVLEVHGDADRIVRYGGGRIFDQPTSEPYPSAAATLDGWARRLGCAGGATSELAGAPPELPALRVERRAPCRRGRAELWTIPGAGHGIASPALLERIWAFLVSASADIVKEAP